MAKVDEASEKAGYGASTWTHTIGGNTFTNHTLHTVGNTLAAHILADKSGKGSIEYYVHKTAGVVEVSSISVNGKSITVKNKQMKTMSPVKQIKAIFEELGVNYKVHQKKTAQPGFENKSFNAELVYEKKS